MENDYRPEDINYAERVSRGIALFDEQWPEWWTEDKGVNIDILDIGSGSRCMTAQGAQILGVGDYWHQGRDHFGLTTGNNGTYISHGFNTESSYNYETGEYRKGWEDFDPDIAIDTLNALWQSEIIRRREAAKSE